MLKQITVVSLACAGLAWSQAPVAPAGPRLVTVNVMVTKDKKPVKGLTKADFTIEDKNKAQTIALFAIADDNRRPFESLDAAIASNRIDSQGEEIGSATIIVYDRVNNELATQARIRQEVLKVLSGLKPTDHIGFYSLGLALPTIVRDYTEEAGVLPGVAKAVQSNSAAQLKTPEEQDLFKVLTQALAPIQELQNQQKVNVTFPAFRVIASHLQGAPGRRNLLWVAGSFPLTFGGTDTNRRENDEGEIEAFRQVLNNAGISLYTVNPAGSGAGFAGASLSGQQTMQLLADSTGGEAYRSANDIVQPLKEVVEATTYSYILGFYPDAGSLDDKNHAIRVTLAKKPETEKAKVLHRKDYLAWNPASRLPEMERMKSRPTLKDAMELRMLETGVGLMAVCRPDPANPAIQVLDIRIGVNDVRFEPVDGKWVAKLTLALGVETPGQPTKALGQEDYKAELTAEDWQEAVKVGGFDIRRRIEMGAGAAGLLRVGVSDNATGVAGSVRVRLGTK